MALTQNINNIKKNKDYGRAVFLITFNEDHSKILMLKRNSQKRKLWKVTWGNIGGKIEQGESSLKAIIREAFEETMLKLNEENLLLLSIKEIPNVKKNWHPIHFFYGTSISENKDIILDEESEDYSWFDIDKLPTDMFDSHDFILNLRSIFKNSFRKEVLNKFNRDKY